MEQEAKFLQLEDEARMKDNGEKGTGQDAKIMNSGGGMLGGGVFIRRAI